MRLGILGGGQLAQMLTQAAISLGIETAIFERFADSPASRLTKHDVVGDWHDDAALARFAAMCNAVTLENEFVDASIAAKLEDKFNLPVYPSSRMLAQVQDKLIQKHTMRAAGVPVPEFQEVESLEQVYSFAAQFGYPVVLKARRDGYDGYGNVTINTAEDVPDAWARLSAGGRKLLVEAYVPFVRELAVMILRGRDGEIRCYPVVETVQQNHVCHVVRAPAPVPAETAQQAGQIARKAVGAIGGVGVFGVELFELACGDLLYNEIAPRPHNTGHYTIEACVTSQFENHIRAVMGLPLGSTEMITPAAVMVNLLGTRDGEANSDAIASVLGVPDVHLHLYGKRQVRRGRKMGHITVLSNTVDEAETVARHAASLVKL